MPSQLRTAASTERQSQVLPQPNMSSWRLANLRAFCCLASEKHAHRKQQEISPQEYEERQTRLSNAFASKAPPLPPFFLPLLALVSPFPTTAFPLNAYLQKRLLQTAASLLAGMG